MKAFLECVPCILNQVIKILQKKVKNQKKRDKIMQAVLARLSKVSPSSMTPPDLTYVAHQALKEVLGDIDYYKEEKKESNREALKLLPKLPDSLHDALLLAIAGNIIDYGPEHEFDIKQTLKDILHKKLSKKHITALQEKLKQAKNLLYICDNAGEIVFDRLLIEYLKKNYNLNITVAVKSRPVLNDALLSDAKIAGMDKVAAVIESGSVTAGTNLESTDKNFRKIYDRADIIIAKGQGNFETLPHNQKTFFLLMIKCRHLALATGLKYGEVVLWKKS
ncbi:hypothetical protein A2276_00150 [candidate division WOR-1 bacterium RIFOXYA12_FULL_43_27]|uniref:Damage-control phosphatase ARMT1-like metal-binding domain-containing protein n=1 Tax=candidate division WOR-1 bacterium RIFOXYC2_FULL_46_14 TaxID=1802587 RepID=A0A1F4U4I6_UNCSA|nr:MAG: hypothetical protein A2276_00150 [candidate division WOR-1 bacterium RIFOXYA12_FULL_43_27]OGC20891.1 MAG: hypothetical protein A2292_07725 [candidate division WOR-1 bacterium RIFOXYB2_FULL_46_45]OGC31371.1 MAG: hypothetical protein A2232_03720 [candidate division WOR-1 bacterium RIFOXYA2_FULL_46_56]OGC39777.1 MAG: hypothetical protein A2438_04555 [candidate division WOR-1 bacterium RIFOXYC2_FULL_46_14]